MSRKRSSLVVGLALAVVGALAACGDSSPAGGNGNGGGTPPPPPPPPPPAADVTIVVDNLAFIDPDGNTNAEFNLTIDLGESIRFDNDDSVGHTVTSSDEPAGGTPFDENLPVGASVVIQPDAQGVWTFFCEVHPNVMVDATITVN